MAEKIEANNFRPKQLATKMSNSTSSIVAEDIEMGKKAKCHEIVRIAEHEKNGDDDAISSDSEFSSSCDDVDMKSPTKKKVTKPRSKSSPRSESNMERKQLATKMGNLTSSTAANCKGKESANKDSNPGNTICHKLAGILLGSDEGDNATHGALAQSIMDAATRWSGGERKRYVQKMRDLMFNLRKNAKLRRNVVCGALSAKELVAASSYLLASDEILLQRKQIREAMLKERVRTENIDKLKRDAYHTDKSKVLNFEQGGRNKDSDC